MWTRSELKRKAKNCMRRNYINMAAVAVIFMLIVNAQTYFNAYFNTDEQSSVISSMNSIGNMTDSSNIRHYSGLFSRKTKSDEYFSNDEEYQDGAAEESAAGAESLGAEDLDAQVLFGNLTYEEAMKMEPDELLHAYFGFFRSQFEGVKLKKALPFTFFWFLFYLLISNAVEVGTCAFFLENTEQKVPMREILRGFKFSYVRNFTTVFIRDIKVFLWTLLFFIPGIIKSLEYRMVPYLLAEYPELTRKEAFYYSKELMRGEKWDALVLDFSFILWMILDALTAGIAGILWVNPYQMATNAELYKKLKELKGINL